MCKPPAVIALAAFDLGLGLQRSGDERGICGLAGKVFRHPIGGERRLPPTLHAMDIPERDQGLGGAGIVSARNKGPGRGRQRGCHGVELGKFAGRVAGAAIVIDEGVDHRRAPLARGHRVVRAPGGRCEHRGSQGQHNDAGAAPCGHPRCGRYATDRGRQRRPTGRLRRHDGGLPLRSTLSPGYIEFGPNTCERAHVPAGARVRRMSERSCRAGRGRISRASDPRYLRPHKDRTCKGDAQ